MPFALRLKRASRLRALLDNSGFPTRMYGRPWRRMKKAVNDMTIMAKLSDLERQHKALEHEIAETLAHRSTSDLKIAELKRRKLTLKDQIERLRHDHAL